MAGGPKISAAVLSVGAFLCGALSVVFAVWSFSKASALETRATEIARVIEEARKPMKSVIPALLDQREVGVMEQFLKAKANLDAALLSRPEYERLERGMKMHKLSGGTALCVAVGFFGLALFQLRRLGRREAGPVSLFSAGGR